MVAEVVNFSDVERDIDKLLYDIRDTASDTINGGLMVVTKQAYDYTPKSSPQKIRMDMQMKYEGGRYTKGEMIVRKARKDKGLGFPTRDELDKEVKQLIKRKIQTIGYLKSGWFPAIYRLITACRKSEFSKVIRNYDVEFDGTEVKLLGSTPKGGVRVAYKRIGIMTAEAWNSAGQGKYYSKAKEVLTTALNKAVKKSFRKVKPFAEEMMNAMLKSKRWV